MKIVYDPIRFSADHLAVIDQANVIVEELHRQGYDLTLRQLYYQFVSRGWMPNDQKQYKRLSDIINRGRLAGRISWMAIEDRTRGLSGTGHWEDPASVIDSAAFGFRVDKWTLQPRRVELWVEKEALAGVIGSSAHQWDLNYFSCRGYVSASEQWRAAQRFGRYLRAGQTVTILHLGDHDPSGIDMTRDITDRLRQFIAVDWLREHPSLGTVDAYDLDEVWADITDELGPNPVEVRRIALNMDQIRRYNPPPNPAKMTDSRANGYVAAHGNQSWELDALNPRTLSQLIDTHVGGIIDQPLYDARKAEEDRHRDLLSRASQRWSELVEVLES